MGTTDKRYTRGFALALMKAPTSGSIELVIADTKAKHTNQCSTNGVSLQRRQHHTHQPEAFEVFHSP